jgi:hypothetical protein
MGRNSGVGNTVSKNEIGYERAHIEMRLAHAPLLRHLRLGDRFGLWHGDIHAPRSPRTKIPAHWRNRRAKRTGYLAT